MFFDSINSIDGCYEFMEQKVCVSLREHENNNVEEPLLELSKKTVDSGKLKNIFLLLR